MRASRLENWFDAIVGVFVVWVVMLAACTAQRQPGKTVASVFVNEYCDQMAGAFDLASQAVSRGEISTDKQLLEMLQGLTEKARASAAQPVDRYLEQNISDGKLADKDAVALKELANQFEALSGR
jgi:hypothetical protein